jgi:hypothetical protein
MSGKTLRQRLSSSDEFFDRVYSRSVPHHASHRRRLGRRNARWLTPFSKAEVHRLFSRLTKVETKVAQLRKHCRWIPFGAEEVLAVKLRWYLFNYPGSSHLMLVPAGRSTSPR